MPPIRNAAVATALAGAVLWFATGAWAADLKVEAETMSIASGYGNVFSDAAASGGKGMLVYRNATTSKTVTTPKSTRIVVRARGDQCGGAPRMSVLLDGSSVYSVSVSAKTWTDYGFNRAVSAASHKIGVRFTNDYRTSSCDRNLRVDTVTFVAAVTATPPTPTPVATPTPTPAPTTASLYVDPYSQAKQAADSLRSSRPADAALIDKIANQPQAVWLGEWSGNVATAADSVLDAAGTKTVVFVVYNIPQRDCGLYSAGGLQPDAYRSWIRSLQSGIGSRSAMVVLEPDALAGVTCLSAADQSTRYELLRDAVSVLKSGAGTKVYIDTGHSGWLSASEAASRLNNAGIAQADGFSLNVSNFRTTATEVSYGTTISSATGGKHFVVDVSRNGLGPDPNGEWCNPSGRALGSPPTLQTGHALADAYLWIKRPGESDGTCNGGPPSGQWWTDYALGLAQRAAW